MRKNLTKHFGCSEEWLKRMDQNISSIKLIMESTYGKDLALKWTVYWRTFSIAVAELCGYNNGWLRISFSRRDENLRAYYTCRNDLIRTLDFHFNLVEFTYQLATHNW